MPDDAQVGVWLFAYRLLEDQDWAGIVTLGRLGDPFGPAPRREQIQFGLSQIGTVPESRTGLYDSVLAAFRTMTGSYDPERVNSVLVFTDGTNDAPDGVSLEDMLTALRDEYDPARPVQIVVVGIGDGVDRGVLEQIAGATRGRVHLATTPEQIEQVKQVLLTDLSRRSTEQ
jgi:Mg-chelatase subunit ChlD